MGHANQPAIGLFYQRAGVPMRRSLVVAVAGVMLLGLATSGGSARASVFPGTNGKIAFSGPCPDDAWACVAVTIDPDGTDETQITAVGGLGCEVWSPDGSKLLLCVWQGSPLSETRPATANPDGSDFTLLDYYPELQQGLFCAYWSPNGARWLCNSNDQVGDPPPPGAAGIYTVRSSDGGDRRQVISTPDGFFDVGRGYSPDGSRILFLREDPFDHRALYAVNPDGTDPLRLSPPGLSIIDLDFFEGLVDWSPDGSRVTFAARDLSRRGSPRALYVVNADGTGLHQITPPGVGARSAQWSPNGRLIAFTNCCGAPQVWVVHPDGTGLREVTVPTRGSTSWTPVWSPDGTKLLFQRIDRDGSVALLTVNVDGTGLSKVTDLPDLRSYSWGTAPPS